MTFTLTIDTKSDAFLDDFYQELASILHTLAGDVAFSVMYSMAREILKSGLTIRDSNGVNVGLARLEETQS